MSLFDIFAADAAYILNDIGRDISYRGVTVKAVCSDPSSVDMLSVGGFSSAGDAQSFKLLRSAYANALPAEGELLTFNSITWVISSVETRPQSPWVKIDCKRWDA